MSELLDNVGKSYLGSHSVVDGLLRNFAVKGLPLAANGDFETLGEEAYHLASILLGNDDEYPHPAWNSPGQIDEYVAIALGVESDDPTERVAGGLFRMLTELGEIANGVRGMFGEQWKWQASDVISRYVRAFMGVDALPPAEGEEEKGAPTLPPSRLEKAFRLGVKGRYKTDVEYVVQVYDEYGDIIDQDTGYSTAGQAIASMNSMKLEPGETAEVEKWTSKWDMELQGDLHDRRQEVVAKRGKSLHTKGAGTCEQGQTQANTGCTPASHEAAPKKPAKPKQPMPSYRTEEEETPPTKRRAERGKLVTAKREGKGKDAKVILSNGEVAPAHITPAMIPPAWSHVKISMNPDADVLVTGKMKNKLGKLVNKTVYNEKFNATNQAAKFAKIQEGLTKLREMAAENQENRKDPAKIEEADCVWLMQEQATRPGSEADTKGLESLYGQTMSTQNVVITRKTTGKRVKKTTVSVALKFGDKTVPIRDEGAKEQLIKLAESGGDLHDSTFWLKSHGATTLEGRHVVEDADGGARLQFMGKESVWHDHKIRDPKLAAMLLERKKKAGDTGKLFNTDNNKVGEYSRSLDGGKFTPKDFRTMKATEMAINEINQREAPANAEEYQKTVMEIATVVSGVLGNKPAQALESYISPTVWSKWQDAIADMAA